MHHSAGVTSCVSDGQSLGLIYAIYTVIDQFRTDQSQYSEPPYSDFCGTEYSDLASDSSSLARTPTHFRASVDMASMLFPIAGESAHADIHASLMAAPNEFRAQEEGFPILRSAEFVENGLNGVQCQGCSTKRRQKRTRTKGKQVSPYTQRTALTRESNDSI